VTKILRVRNLAQKVLWEQELSGQISDGRWENSSPHSHWEPWCDATIVVDPEHVGRNFYARRESYNFSSKELLDIVGDRMLRYVQVLTGDASYDMARMRADLNDLKKVIKEHVADSVPVPPQPTEYRAALRLDGYAQVYTTFVPLANDNLAVKQLAKREREQRDYRIKRLEEKRDELKAQLAKVEDDLAREVDAAGMLV